MLSPRADATATRGTAARIAPADIAAVVVSPRAEKRGNALSRRSEDASSRVRRTTVRAPVITHMVFTSHTKDQTDAKIRCPIRCELETETESRPPVVDPIGLDDTESINCTAFGRRHL